MKIHILGSKINFIDKNNVLVGFDLAQDCCETAEWTLSFKPGGEPIAEKFMSDAYLKPFVFDPETVNKKPVVVEDEEKYENGGAITFTLRGRRKMLYLTISNSHNGYYSHGFNVDVGGKTIWEGVL